MESFQYYNATIDSQNNFREHLKLLPDQNSQHLPLLYNEGRYEQRTFKVQETRNFVLIQLI